MVTAVALPTREHLIATARRTLDAQGLEGLTLREIARRGRLSHGAPLRHFPSLASLLAALGAEGFRDLMREVEGAVGTLSMRATARERLAAAGRGYLRFARGNPGVFSLMFRPERVDVLDAAYAAAGRASFGQLCGLCAAAQSEGFEPDVPTEQLASVVWASVHGLAQLSLQGVLGGPARTDTKDEIHDLMNRMLLGVGPASRRGKRVARRSPR